ncbi:MAG: hypothetical protein CMM01_22260 [Rhodopirellula sp.]|nr:hypothetical protein [Rhodopirellula sp.]OUX49535.1 MAG: hypothetical protein CBE43_10045 [Rhodopirellula sp. TMED283]
MNCCFYRLLHTSILASLVFCGGSPVAFGQLKDKVTRPHQAVVSEVELTDPAEPMVHEEAPLGDKEVDKKTLTPPLGSPDTSAIFDDTPPTRQELKAISAPVIERLEAEIIAVSPPQEKGISSQLGRGPGPNENDQGYRKAVPGKAEVVEYQELDAKTSRDMFNADSIQNLRKPMSDIRIVAEDNADAPEDLAARFMLKEPVLKIVAAGISPPQPDRYPIAFKHRPLYYEQPNIERCGRGCGIAQNAISAGQFCMKTFTLPYHMCKTRPGCPIAAGGDCLNCKPYSLNCNVLPLSYKGIATEAAAFAGFTFLLL